ncbi:MAG TPA: transglycosylase domain-containing protein, partial [Myxococcaceae bacterium]|nr:transglycosylase domain-containing protein [Myxococcaceae bacterium]
MREPAPPELPEEESRPPSRLVLVETPPPERTRRRRILVALGKVFGFLALTGLTGVTAAFLFLYYRFSEGLPEIPRVSAYAPPVLSEVFTDDQVLAGEFYAERRKVVPYERIPKRLVQAFIASEDAAFFDHPGFDPVGTLRA